MDEPHWHRTSGQPTSLLSRKNQTTGKVRFWIGPSRVSLQPILIRNTNESQSRRAAVEPRSLSLCTIKHLPSPSFSRVDNNPSNDLCHTGIRLPFVWPTSIVLGVRAGVVQFILRRVCSNSFFRRCALAAHDCFYPFVLMSASLQFEPNAFRSVSVKIVSSALCAAPGGITSGIVPARALPSLVWIRWTG